MKKAKASARAKKTEVLLVWVAVVHYKHGTNVYLSRSRSGVTRQLFAYVKDYWDDAFSGRAIPKSERNAIREYFNFPEIEHSEYVDISKEEVCE